MKQYMYYMVVICIAILSMASCRGTRTGMGGRNNHHHGTHYHVGGNWRMTH